MDDSVTYKLGKIMEAELRFGGYQDAMIGFQFTLGSDKGSYGPWECGDFWGYWAIERNKTAKWTEKDRVESLGEKVLEVTKLLQQANVESLSQLKGKPIEARFEKSALKSWRILEEVV